MQSGWMHVMTKNIQICVFVTLSERKRKLCQASKDIKLGKGVNNMTPEENDKRKKDPHVEYIKKKICAKNNGKPFVFISYKSDDWEVVLADVAYRLVKDYGLNIYFDGDFDLHNASWIEQFPTNMESVHCKGVIAFIDSKYSTSYATLLELMYSQTCKASQGGKKENDGLLPVVTVNLESLKKIPDESYDKNTGLGDANENIIAKSEKEKFNKVFSELKERKILKNAVHLYDVTNPKEILTMYVCQEITKEMIAHLGVNENRYKKGSDLDDIVSSIRDACGNEVFSSPGSDDGGSIEESKSQKKGKPKKSVDTRENPTQVLPESPKSVNSDITEATTLKEFFTMCESPQVCLALREVREHVKKQFFDYMMAALLRGCDEKSFKLSKGKEEILVPARWNYCTYAVSRNYDPKNPKCGSSQFTWTSNSRKAVGIEGSGTLGHNSDIFAELSETETLGTIKQKFIEEKETGFITKNNQQVLAAFDELFKMSAGEGEK